MAGPSHRSQMSASGSITRKRVGSMSQREPGPSPVDVQTIQMPSNPQNALALKTASLASTKSLFQTCSHLRKRLRCVEDFPPFLEQSSTAEHLDVVSHMCHLFRMGSPLCHLYNLLIPSFSDPRSGVYGPGPSPKRIEYEYPAFSDSPEGIRNWAKRPENSKICQRLIAQFCMAMKERQSEGRWRGEIWALHELWGKSSGDEAENYDSTGLMKVLHTVETMLDNLPDSAVSPLSPTTPFTALSSQQGSVRGHSMSHMSRPSYDLPFTMGGSGSGTSTFATMTATMNGGVHVGAQYPGGEDMVRGASKSSAEANAFKSVEELVASEKSYVQELEILVRCSQELVAKHLISTDTNHQMFSNLSKILDFHRKFLIKLETEYEPIEEIGPDAWGEGRWGRPFVSSEAEFDCYGPYCANYLEAIKLVTEQMPNLMLGQELPPNERPCLHPERELQAFMIKPIQRITKYGLLLDAVLKATQKHAYAHRTELEEGAAAVRRIATSINEVTDYKAKQATVRELMDRVEDWKGHDLDKFGDLWLDDHFTVIKADQPRDYHMFLFERMLLCAKEVVPERKKSTKNSSMLRKDKTASKASLPEKRKVALKGRIFVSNIDRATVISAEPGEGNPRLVVVWTVPQQSNGWREEIEDSFVMIGRSEEQLRKWADKILELAVAERKKQVEDRAERMRRTSNGRYSGDRAQMPSGFTPMTPATESSPFGFPTPGEDDDEELSGFRSGRTTPSIGSSTAHMANGYGYGGPSASRRAQSQQGIPPASLGDVRARAMTEDQSGPNMTQWRTAPPLPRLQSAQSAVSSVSMASEASFGTIPRSAGRQFSASRIPRPGGIDEESEGSTDAEFMSQRPPRPIPPRGMQRAPSHQLPPSVPHPPPMLRTRSASSSQTYPMPMSHHAPIPAMPPTRPPYSSQPWNDSSVMSSSSTLVGGTAYFNKRISGGKRSSGDSQSTETSETSKTSSQISPSTPYGAPSDGPPGIVSRQNSSDTGLPILGGGAGKVRVRVQSGNAQFMLDVPTNIIFSIFHEKVSKKVKMCGASNISDKMALKWIDADGDEIAIQCDADVEAMFGETRDNGGNMVNIVVR